MKFIIYLIFFKVNIVSKLFIHEVVKIKAVYNNCSLRQNRNLCFIYKFARALISLNFTLRAASNVARTILCVQQYSRGTILNINEHQRKDTLI